MACCVSTERMELGLCLFEGLVTVVSGVDYGCHGFTTAPGRGKRAYEMLFPGVNRWCFISRSHPFIEPR